MRLTASLTPTRPSGPPPAVVDLSGIPSSSWRGRLLRLPLRLVPRGAHMVILQGPLRGMRWIAGAGPHGCWLGSYEALPTREFLALLRPGCVAYDVGANAGWYTLLSSAFAGPEGRVVAFEPLPRNLRHLRAHVRMNELQNVVVVDAAVGAAAGTASFLEEPSGSMGRLAPQGALQVRVISLDEAVAGGLPPPDVLKMDVEGAEMDVFRGAAKILERHPPRILLSTHGDDLRRDCHALLRGHGYDLTAVGSRPVESSDVVVALPPGSS